MLCRLYRTERERQQQHNNNSNIIENFPEFIILCMIYNNDITLTPKYVRHASTGFFARAKSRRLVLVSLPTLGNLVRVFEG